MWVPHKKKKRIERKEDVRWKGTGEENDSEGFLFFFSFYSLRFFLRFTEIGPSEFVGINTKSALLDEGYA